MQLMLCIEGSIRTNTYTGQVYECVGRFTCPSCGALSDILEFAEPVEEWHSITCNKCKVKTPKIARYANKKRFIPLNDPEHMDEQVYESRQLETTS